MAAGSSAKQRASHSTPLPSSPTALKELLHDLHAFIDYCDKLNSSLVGDSMSPVHVDELNRLLFYLAKSVFPSLDFYKLKEAECAPRSTDFTAGPRLSTSLRYLDHAAAADQLARLVPPVRDWCRYYYSPISVGPTEEGQRLVARATKDPAECENAIRSSFDAFLDLFRNLRNQVLEHYDEVMTAEDDSPVLVTLDQIAATVHTSKRTLERLKKEMPPPAFKPVKRGIAAKWLWSQVRPWLEKRFGPKLPIKYPGAADPERFLG
jgi:hypothetical protein